MGANIYKNKKLIWVFLLPAFLFMLVYLYYPFVQNILNSFRHIKYMGTAGGDWNSPWYINYTKLWADPKMRIALKNTGITIAATSGFFRTVYFFPIVISATALGLLFNLVFLYDKGMVNQFLQFAGYLDRESNELIDWKSKHAMFTMLMPVIWQYVGFYFVILLTGLSGIPSELYEAATIDGGSKWQQVRFITLPLLRNSIGTCVILAVTGALKVFDLPWTMFVNGMSNTWLTGTYMYSKVYSDVDYASAIAVVIVLIGVILSALVNRIFRQNDDYQV